MKRAQAEMIGLLLIVILLAIGFLFYVQFSLSGDDRNYQADFAQTQLGQSYVYSLAKTELQCGGQTYTVADLVKEVAQGTRCPAEDALEELITNTLASTHYLFGSNYRLVIVQKLTDGEETIGLKNFTNPDYPVAEQCNVGRRMVHDSNHYSIPSYGGLLVHIRLEQCS